MQNAVGGVALRPDEQQDIIPLGKRVYLLAQFRSRADRMAVDLCNDIAFTDAGVFSGAAGANILNNSAFQLRRSADLVADIGREIGDGDAENPTGILSGGRSLFGFALLLEFTD